MSNFDFLEEQWSELAKYGRLAESYVYSDPNASMFKQGLLTETMVKYILAYDGLKEPEKVNTHANRIKLLRRKDLLPNEIYNSFYILRKDRNSAAHSGTDEQDRALENLELTYGLCVWFMQTYGNHEYIPDNFIIPTKSEVSMKELEKLSKELEAKATMLESEFMEIQKIGKANTQRRLNAYSNAKDVKLTEAQTREIIDEQLRMVGWEADTKNLRYSKGTRPERGRNIAIAEWPTDSKRGNRGFADYALFVGEKLVGIVEAKRKNIDVSTVLDYQCKDYAKLIKKEHEQYVIGDYRGYKVPFLFSTNGRKYLEEYKEKSGIWFLDTREVYNSSKPLRGWPKPDEVAEDLRRDIAESEKKLLSTGYEVLEDPKCLGLRDYQIEAIKQLEAAIADRKSRGDYENKYLIAMATGTGKTRTILGMIYRFLSARRFKRILYLVDRNALGEQTFDTFTEVKLENLLTLNKIYDIKGLSDKEFEKDTRVHIATVQSLVRRILYNESDKALGVSDYDLVIVDEAHRGYLLDKEMGEDEIWYRDQDDFRSKYKQVIDYFEAVKIALTATPALHTTQIFGQPIYTYDYTTAVVDGWLVDHDVPHIITTKTSKEGITFEAKSTVPVYNLETESIDYTVLEDEIIFEVDQFNKKVVVESFNQVVLKEIFKDIDPSEDGKTLIFAVDDNHADMITRILKDYYNAQGISGDAVMKITGSIENGDQKKIGEAIKKFKNETYPNIVVTVDLLSTGIDVDRIVNLVFMRRIRSRILFEQMLGRATRLCKDIGKTHFEIYDAVGLYQALLPVSSMKPVVVDPKTSFHNLIDGFDIIQDDKARERQVKQIITKIHRIKNRISDKDREKFTSATDGKTPQEYIEAIRKMPLEEAIQMIKKDRAAFDYLKSSPKPRKKFISNTPDEVIAHERGYGESKKPEDYLREFRQFVEENVNQIAALNIVATRPKELTKQSLKELKLELEKHHFKEEWLKSAWKGVTNQEIAADIISFIRQKSLDDALISKDERIHNAILKTKAAHPELGKIQLNWLDRIESYLKNETILNRETFDALAFKKKGGYRVINKAFGENLDAFIEEINEYMYSA